MIITRIYTGDDGQSHMEDFDLSDHPNPESLQSVTSICFGVMSQAGSATGTASHAAITSLRFPVGEIRLGDGSVHGIGPGQVM